ncbi:11075_t:CDS:2, partial [Rhizophagus irregularis]
DTVHTIRYFPKSGSIQVFGSFNPVAIFLRYLSECSLPEFSSVELVGENKALLRNYKFVINIGNDKFINLSTLAYALESIDGFNDADDIHSKITIVFTLKIRVHIWPKSGKKLFFNPYDFEDFICDASIPDCE